MAGMYMAAGLSLVKADPIAKKKEFLKGSSLKVIFTLANLDGAPFNWGFVIPDWI